MAKSIKINRGIFVSGTDTGIGKTLISSIFVKAWQGCYWKPCQTGLANDESSDTDMVARLAFVSPQRLYAPAYEFQAPLSPWDAARLENLTIDTKRFILPNNDLPLVVEGAGGLLVPITDKMMIVDLIKQLGLPVILVARSVLGTINHTLMSLEIARNRGLFVLGVVMSGPLSANNKLAIEKLGKVKVLFEVPFLENIDAKTVEQISRNVPSWEELKNLPKIQF